MRAINRIPKNAPDFLIEADEKSGKPKQKIFTERWRKRVDKFNNKEIKNSPSFNWYEIDRLLRPALSNITERHCAFCDRKFSCDEADRFPIEHFKPKMRFPMNAFEWSNLFPSCTICNSAKGEKYSANLLKSDDLGYNFQDYFIFTFKTGEIRPNPNSTKENQEKAKITIDLYKLNRKGLCKDRIDEIEFFEDFRITQSEIDFYSHRNFIEQVIT